MYPGYATSFSLPLHDSSEQTCIYLLSRKDLTSCEQEITDISFEFQYLNADYIPTKFEIQMANIM
jgi:hypothetical protein